MFENIIYIFLLFIIYSFIGWIVDLIGYYMDTKKIINRGFLIGPYCPVFGFGALIIIALLDRYKEDPLTLFVMTVVCISVLEYFTSYFLEKFFNARWWDYSRLAFNLNGRISLFTSVSFGIFGLLLTYVINPFFLNTLFLIPRNIILIVSIILFILFIGDIIFSFISVYKIKKTIHLSKKDMTEEIKQKVNKEIDKNHIFKAFPKLKHIIDK